VTWPIPSELRLFRLDRRRVEDDREPYGIRLPFNWRFV